MNSELWAGIAGAIITFMAALIALPKIRAEARKANAEAHRIEWGTLNDEIGRQNKQIRELRNEIHSLRNAMTNREGELKTENKALHAEVGRLTRRVEGLESILKVTPLPNDMKELLAEIDRKTAKRSSK